MPPKFTFAPLHCFPVGPSFGVDYTLSLKPKHFRYIERSQSTPLLFGAEGDDRMEAGFVNEVPYPGEADSRETRAIDIGGKRRMRVSAGVLHATTANASFKKELCLIVFIGLLLLTTGFASAAPAAQGYQLHKRITLGGEGGWDYFEVDPVSSHVFIPRDSHILVVDAEGRQVADIPGVTGAHAIAFAPDLGKAFLSTEGSASVLDMATLKIASMIPLPGKDPDAILYDPFTKRVFTFNGGGTQDATAIDALTGKVLGSISLGGKPEFAQTDGEGHIYVNVEDKSRIAAFDAKTLKTLHSWPIAPCKEPSGLAIDVVHKRLFAGCHNRLMAVVDYTNGKVVATAPIGGGVDANRFDPATGLAFASCGEGVITVAHQDSAGKLTVVQTIKTQQGARTMALDTRNHNVYTVTAQFGPPPPATPQEPHPYPSVISKTFTLLIFTP